MRGLKRLLTLFCRVSTFELVPIFSSSSQVLGLSIISDNFL